MSLSKPLFNALSFYFEQMYMHPLRTKSITSAVLASSANFVSQKIMGYKEINHRSLFAYAMFGLLFGGPMPHYFYKMVERTLAGRSKVHQFLLFFAFERLIFMPLFQALSLFFLSIFEGKSQHEAMNHLITLYWPLLIANWKYRSLPVFIGVRYIPPNYRFLTGNVVSFYWAIFITIKRRKLQNQLIEKKKDIDRSITKKKQ